LTTRWSGSVLGRRCWATLFGMAAWVQVREIDGDEGRRLSRIVRRGNGSVVTWRYASHKAQASMIRRYIIWRNKHSADERLRAVVAKANVA
jgi:hypothetical protein